MDLTIERLSVDRPDSKVFTDLLYVKGARWRHEHIAEFPDPAATRHVTHRLVQCDLGRDVGLFPTSQTYFESPIAVQPHGRPATLKIPRRADPLVELSEAPLDQAIFDVPTAYRPALPFRGGGFDPSQPDSIGNRVESYWTWMTSWVSYWLR